MQLERMVSSTRVAERSGRYPDRNVAASQKGLSAPLTSGDSAMLLSAPDNVIYGEDDNFSVIGNSSQNLFILANLLADVLAHISLHFLTIK